MKHRRTAAALICALLMLGGCEKANGGNNDIKAQIDLLQSEIDRLSDENAELRDENGKLRGAKESAEEEFSAQAHDLGQENAKLESEISELKYNIYQKNSEISYYESIIYKGDGYVLRYLGDESDDEGRSVSVLRLEATYIPYIRLDTKATELIAGIMVLGGTYEFANENIDENGYLYLISDEERTVEEDKLPFSPEKYIKLRFIDAETGKYTKFGDYPDNGSYIRHIGFNGKVVISPAYADENGNVRYYEEGTILNVQGTAPLVTFDGEKAE